MFAFGQVTTTGSITGTVADPLGAAVAYANVVAKNNATPQEVNATSSQEGTFIIPNVPPGKYTLTIAALGFKTRILQDVTVNAGVPSSVNAAMQVGGATETVTITGGGGELLQTSL
ncbi:MAG: carboxypeptidase-like regulatory domain-containing protein [Acidobacteria bacterium]|nr:carboxypeptidase-like regulatory domain-containing protein [Acidobacteriota bacterium]